jgi:hypothetical protein
MKEKEEKKIKLKGSRYPALSITINKQLPEVLRAWDRRTLLFLIFGSRFIDS